eukprot:TRINITY_DN3483_c0_g1_i1.p2 TRINITY_DN3483_c0_g1~~TRINITY_DN3483_c0_g1_i1.p2  ORF type:complete len:91 (-),score=2.53 TRINITY_DN3483_c0_g1_i1:13-285(-)
MRLLGLPMRSLRKSLLQKHHFSSKSELVHENVAAPKFDASILPLLACPLTKTPLRYDEATGSLISDEIHVAFPIKDGIPMLNPLDGKMLK